MQRAPVAKPAFYHDLLRPLLRSLDVWETIYLHTLTGPDPVAQWTRGTAARPFLEALGAAGREFMADYAARLRVAYSARHDGTTLFPMRRVFIVGRK
ncbi:MAG: hypothetical protein V1757_08965 [Actinomycetota bacterium]